MKKCNPCLNAKWKCVLQPPLYLGCFRLRPKPKRSLGRFATSNFFSGTTGKEPRHKTESNFQLTQNTYNGGYSE